MPVIWRWSSGDIDPVVVSRNIEEVEQLCRKRGYCVRPEYGKVLVLTDKQWNQLRDDILGGKGPLPASEVPTRV